MNWVPGESVLLELPRATLRSLDMNHVDGRYLEWLRDPQVIRYQNARFEDVSEQKLREFVAGHDNNETFLLGIFDLRSGLHIGNHRAVCDLNHLRAHIGVMIGDKNFWGSGIVAETRSTLLDFLFEVRGLHKVCGSVYSDNVASVYNYQALGFEAEAIRVSHVVSDAHRCDLIEFALFRDAWAKRREKAG
jgi:ribosomal-protein-alanine N-acetyltransferase